MYQLPRTVIIAAPDEVNNQHRAMPTPYIWSCKKSYCITNPRHSIQTATHTQQFHKTYVFVSTSQTEKIDVSGLAMWEDGHTMSSHEDTAKRDTLFCLLIGWSSECQSNVFVYLR